MYAPRHTRSSCQTLYLCLVDLWKERQTTANITVDECFKPYSIISQPNLLLPAGSEGCHWCLVEVRWRSIPVHLFFFNETIDRILQWLVEISLECGKCRFELLLALLFRLFSCSFTMFTGTFIFRYSDIEIKEKKSCS